MDALSGLQRVLTVAQFVKAAADGAQSGDELIVQRLLAGVEFLFERVQPVCHLGELVAHFHEKLIFGGRCGGGCWLVCLSARYRLFRSCLRGCIQRRRWLCERG